MLEWQRIHADMEVGRYTKDYKPLLEEESNR